MKAWILREPAPMEEHPLEFVEVPTPQPGPHQVRLQVTVCGICRTDLHIAEGDLHARKHPLILGHEIVGVVDAVGEDVSRIRVGELAGVAGYCAYRLLEAGEHASIGLYGFGPTAYYVLRVARHFGHDVYVSSRSEQNLRRARQSGATWAGTSAPSTTSTDGIRKSSWDWPGRST